MKKLRNRRASSTRTLCLFSLRPPMQKERGGGRDVPTLVLLSVKPPNPNILRAKTTARRSKRLDIEFLNHPRKQLARLALTCRRQFDDLRGQIAPLRIV